MKLWRWTGEGSYFEAIYCVANTHLEALDRIHLSLINWDDPMPEWASLNQLSQHLVCCRDDEEITISLQHFGGTFTLETKLTEVMFGPDNTWSQWPHLECTATARMWVQHLTRQNDQIIHVRCR